MSLDIYFTQRKNCPNCDHALSDGEDVFWHNITHNLGRMASEAGFYKQLWRPEENEIETAGQLAPHIEDGLRRLKCSPKKYKKFNSDNAWGTYEDFVPWLEKLLAACKEYPDAIVRVSR